MLETPIEKLQLSSRTYNCLKRARINTVGDVLHMSEGRPPEYTQLYREAAGRVTAETG